MKSKGMKSMDSTSVRADRAKPFWRESDRLYDKAKQMRAEADALDRSAKHLYRMACAVADGRDGDFTKEAQDLSQSQRRLLRLRLRARLTKM
jgi:hypothetical protein